MYIEDMNNENREFEVKEQLEKERKDIKSFDDLVAFLQRVKDNCNTGYGTAPRAIAQATLATARFLSSAFGITGFQAGCVMWDFLRGWLYSGNECGMKIVDYDEMLYPQYEYKYEKTIRKDTFEALQKAAKDRIEKSSEYTHPIVLKHWESIVNGNVPFGYKVKND
jgi:hypothetical protein